MARPSPSRLPLMATGPAPRFEPDAVIARPAAARIVGAASGSSASSTALARLHQAIADLEALRSQALLPILQQALNAVRAQNPVEGSRLAMEALQLDEACGVGWHILAICREQADDFTSSLKCYETALALTPDEPEIANDLGRLSYRMGFKDIAEQMFLAYLQKAPGSLEGINNLACAQRDQMRYDDAIETVRSGILTNPTASLLWNTLASIVAERGDMDQSIQFFDEAIRLEPLNHKARYNRGNAKLSLGDTTGALGDCEDALPRVALDSERAMMGLARSLMLIADGRLGDGWDAYEARFDPHYADVTHFMIDRPQWTPDMDLAGKSMLLMGEQGLGDEVLFASLAPDLLEALGPEGKLTMAVEQRLVPLLQRSFPNAVVGPHGTLRIDHHTVRAARFVPDEAMAEFDVWAPMASPLRRFRREVEAFPTRRAFLTPDPARVAHWRAVLKAEGDQPHVGVIWKSLHIDSARARYFSPFDRWAPVLTTAGAQMVNLQYGDSAEEIAEAKARLCVDLWTPPGIDLKNDLDDLAALTTALDLIIGPANATTNIAAASGANVWLISTPGAWPKLGTDRYPWYPQVRVFNPPAYNVWEPVMDEVAAALQIAIDGRSFAGT